jgi:hypothetical protein
LFLAFNYLKVLHSFFVILPLKKLKSLLANRVSKVDATNTVIEKRDRALMQQVKISHEEKQKEVAAAK